MTEDEKRMYRYMELQKCSYCGEPYDLEPCNAHHKRISDDRNRVKPGLGVSLKVRLLAIPPKDL